MKPLTIAIALMIGLLSVDLPAASTPGRSTPRRGAIVTLPSGLSYRVIRSGNGAHPGPTSRVTVHYHGTLLNGSIIDTTRGRAARTFPLNALIPGWRVGLQLMREGSIWVLTIPAHLAYGATARRRIPANSTLVFRIELLRVH